jgi:glycosyltransferase involved in cell wall biosynthesis
MRDSLFCRESINVEAILFLHDKNNISGGEQSLLNLWRNLDRSIFKIYLLLPNKGALENEAKSIGVFVDLCDIPKFRFKNIVSILIAGYNLWLYCKKHEIKLIHSYTPRNNILSVIVGKILGMPVIWHERNIPVKAEPDISRRYSFLPKRIICNSNAVAERFRTKNGISLKVTVVINGVDTKHFSPENPPKELKEAINSEDKPIVGLISNLGKRKMPEYFLDAAYHILEKMSGVIFLIVGGEFAEEDKGRQGELLEKARSLGIEKNVIFTGFVPNVVEYIRLSSLGAAVTEKEACSRAILEMMACGKPVVAFDTGGNPELIEHGVTGKLVPFGDIQAFADAVIELLKDECKRDIMGKQARLRAERLFDVRVNAKRTQEIYTELLGHRGS